MKKNLFFLFALICSVSLFTACSDDDNNNGESVHPNSGVYKMASYETTSVTDSQGKVKENVPTAGALYINWKLVEEDAFVANFTPVLRYVGGSLLPQVLNTISLENDGNVLADYVAKPSVQMDMQSTMMIFMGFKPYPTKAEIESAFPTSGFTSSPKGMATWSEKGGRFLLKLNLGAIMANKMGGDAAQMQGIIDGVLNSKPSELKAMLGALLKVDFSTVQDASIEQLMNWAKNGVPMNLSVNENGNTVIALDKKALDTFMTVRDSGKVDDFGDPVMTNDLLEIWNALLAAKVIPAEAQSAGAMLQLFAAYWGRTATFDLGLELTKK